MIGVAVMGSRPQYWRHLLPIADALDIPPALRFPPGRPWPRNLDAVWVVASWADSQAVKPRPYVYVEHGAGQTYSDGLAAGHGAYSGGAGHERCVLFVCPNETVAERWRKAYPSTQAVAVGCPALDRYHGQTRTADRIVVAFHWDNRRSSPPELRGASSEYLPAMGAIADRWPILGHGHPRGWANLRRQWHRLDVATVDDCDQALDRAALVVVDNSSIAVEAAALGVPVVWLNASWYRRDVDHGGRFWTWARAGGQVDRPDQLAGAVETAMGDPPRLADARREVAQAVYGTLDGKASERAAAAVSAVIGEVDATIACRRSTTHGP